MKTKTFTVRAAPEDIERWKEAAGSMRFNDWVKLALKGQAELDESDGRRKKSSQRERQQALSVTYPQGSCAKSGYCYVHDTRHV